MPSFTTESHGQPCYVVARSPDGAPVKVRAISNQLTTDSVPDRNFREVLLRGTLTPTLRYDARLPVGV